MKYRIFTIALAGALLISGFAFGRMSDTPGTNAAEDTKAVNQLTENASTSTAEKVQPFYLSDFKTGYSDGYNSGLSGSAQSLAATEREGYNEGFKQGFADGYQVKASGVEQRTAAPALARTGTQREVVYRSAPRKSSSKLKTALTIAAPAAIGAGVGGIVGGGKGAGVGALLGGGGGAVYHLIKNRDKN